MRSTCRLYKSAVRVANLTWYPVERIWVGVELLYGIRENRNGHTGDDLRVSVSAQYRF